MINKDLKKLNRRELVDIIYQMKKNEQQMQEEIAALQEALQDKRIKLTSAGSIAEAATEITQIFSTAQTTADLYLHEIACMKAETEEKCAKMIENARKQVSDILANGEKQYAHLKTCYEADYKMIQLLREELHGLEPQKSVES